MMMLRVSFALSVFMAVLGFSRVWAQTCLITVPQNPLSAVGLSTPWIQTGCTQLPMTVMVGNTGNVGTASFFQAAIVNLDTGAISTYSPLVLDAAAASATQQTNVAAIPATVPVLPTNYVAAIFGGTNGNTVTLQATVTNGLNSLVEGNCVNGGGNTNLFSIFGQFSCCNCVNFMQAVYTLIKSGTITVGQAAAANNVPALGKDVFGNTCPTTHSFAIVDQDQSDNVPNRYLSVTKTSQLAQSTLPNKAKLGAGNFIEFDNGSDEDVIVLVQNAIGCHPWTVQDLADPTATTFFATSLTNEVQALLLQPAPRAFVPNQDPMTTFTNGQGVAVADLSKLNAYRTAIGQTQLTNVAQAAPLDYCNNLYAAGAPLLAQWLPLLVQVPAPDFGAGVSNTLGGVLVGRFGVTVMMLNCNGLTGVANPFNNFSGVGAGGPLFCPAPFNPLTCQLGTGLSQTAIAAALGVTNVQTSTNGQTTFDVPVPVGVSMAT